jgi:hypothetical protein
MCRRKTYSMQTIEAMCASQNIEPEDLFIKAKLLLGSYRRVCWASLGSCRTENEDGYCICDENIRQALDYLNTYPPTENRALFERKLKTLFDSRWMVELVDSAMIQVKEFPDSGERYFEILSKYYLSKFKYCESELLEVLQLERSAYYDRKKEAVLAFGLALWGTVLPKIEAILDEDTDDEYDENECPD